MVWRQVLRGSWPWRPLTFAARPSTRNEMFHLLQVHQRFDGPSGGFGLSREIEVKWWPFPCTSFMDIYSPAVYAGSQIRCCWLWRCNNLHHLCASKSFLSVSSCGCFTREEKQSAREMGAVTRSFAGGKYFQPWWEGWQHKWLADGQIGRWWWEARRVGRRNIFWKHDVAPGSAKCIKSRLGSGNYVIRERREAGY